MGEGTSCRYDGHRWQDVGQPGFPKLADVSAAGPDAVWQVGADVVCDPFNCVFSPVIQRFDGAQWRDVPHPLAPSLDGVQAIADDDVYAVGTNSVGTVIQHWDGSQWSDVPSPDPGRGGGLAAVDAEEATLWSVGSFFDSDSDAQTLTLQAPSSTQGQIVGHTNVGQATVSWFGAVTGSTTTDVFGDYAIPGFPAGTYVVTVANEGCDPASARVTVAANQTLTQNLRLNC